MERLTQRNEKGGITVENVSAALEKLAQYEDAEESGRLALPCRIGDTVYQTDGVRIYECRVKNLLFDTDGICFDERAVGESVFLTREEAEKNLEKRKAFATRLTRRGW